MEVRRRVPYGPPGLKGQPPPPSGRRLWLLERLSVGDGPSYDRLCFEVVEACTNGGSYIAKVRGVRAVRFLLWHCEAVCAPDETVWITPKGLLSLRSANSRSNGATARFGTKIGPGAPVKAPSPIGRGRIV